MTHGSEATEPLPVLRVEQSSTEARRLVLLAVGMVALCGYVVLSATSAWAAAIGWVGVAFFGFGAAVLVHRLLRLRGPVVVVDETGIHDVRVSRDPLPWHDVRSALVWRYGGQQVLVLGVDDAVWDRIGVLALPRSARGANKALGLDGLAFTTQGLPISLDELHAAVTAHVARAAGTA